MGSLWIHLVVMLVIILISSQLFTNALEHFGQKINISTGVTGSIFAAIATALPETMIPVIAIIAGTQNETINQEISVGAILGAPLMLSTLSVFLMALAAIKKRGLKGHIKPEKKGFVRDMNFFLIAFILAATALYAPLQPTACRASISLLLVGLYIIYLALTLKTSKSLVNNGHGVKIDEPLILTLIGFKNNLTTIAVQLLVGLVLLLVGAKGFIHDVEAISTSWHISALILSLIIIPIATELPEKVNSILWIRKNKDTLAMGNITGAMVFQGTLLPALGIMLTPWQPSYEVLTGIVIAFVAAAWMRVNMRGNGLSVVSFGVNMGLYLMYLFLALR